MKRYPYALLALALGGLLTWRALPSAQLDTQETPLGRLPAGDSGLAVSPDGRRTAVIESPGCGQAVVVDGVRWGKRYTWVAGVWFSPDSRHVACVAEEGGRQFVVVDGVEGPRHERVLGRGPLFRPNSRYVAYEAQDGERHFMVVDGKAEPRYEAVSHFCFSEDGKHYAYVGRRGQHDYRVVLDGREDGESHCEIGPVHVNKGGDHVAYACATEPARNGPKVWRVALHGIDGKKAYQGRAAGYAHIPSAGLRFSPDGKRLAFLAQSGRQVLVVDGVEGKAYRHIDAACGFSDDGKHFAYVGDGRIVRDGDESGGRIGIWRLTFSPDGKRLAAAGVLDHRPVVMVDGVVVPGSVDRVDASVRLVFSRDGKQLAFATKHSVFRNGVEGKRYAGVVADSLTFDPSGRRLAYVASPGPGTYCVVTDEVTGSGYHAIQAGSLTFSEDGKHVAYLARRGNRWWPGGIQRWRAAWLPVVDGVEGEAYDHFPAVPRWTGEGPRRLRGVAVRGGQLLRVGLRIGRRWPWDLLGQ